MYNGESIIRWHNTCGLPRLLVEFFAQGRESPMESDSAIVKVNVSLPSTQAKGHPVEPEYTFGDQVVFCGLPLIATWGEELVPNLRTMSMTATAATFREAFDGLQNDVLKEIKKLAKEYFDRQDRLKECYY